MPYLVSVKLTKKRKKSPHTHTTRSRAPSTAKYFFHYSFFVLIIMFMFMLANYVMLSSEHLNIYLPVIYSYILSELPIVLHSVFKKAFFYALVL